VKHDGFRVLVLKQGERVRVWSRRGADFTERFSRIAEAVCALPVEQALIDGEAVVFRSDGLSDFAAIRTKAGAAEASYVAFDLLTLAGKDIRLQPIEDRRAELERNVRGRAAGEPIAADGELVFAKACALGLEGIVSKRARGLYRSGPSPSWRKIKNPAFART
jgi:bifunctional non-homologous end joining protein LigD